MRAPEPLITAVDRDFNSFDEFGEATALWDLDFRQLGRGKLSADLHQLVGEDCSFVSARFSRRCLQKGVSIAGMRTFAILEQGATPTIWCGKHYSDRSVAVFEDHGEFECISPAGFSVFTLSFSLEQLAALASATGLPTPDERFGPKGVVFTPDPDDLMKIRNMASEAMLYLRRSTCSGQRSSALRTLTETVPLKLVQLGSHAKLEYKSPLKGTRLKALRKARDYIQANLQSNPTVLAAAQYAGITTRSLEYLFREYFDITPKSYINALQLNEVYRELKRNRGNRSITEAANAIGFWHLGQFARDYRRQFGTLPSETEASDKGCV